MKHFIVEITYKIPVEQFENIVPQHRAFLQTGYDKKLLLCSGPQEPRVGGIVVARGESLEEIKSFFENDPYKINDIAAYRFIEFNPVKHQEFLSSWIN